MDCTRFLCYRIRDRRRPVGIEPGEGMEQPRRTQQAGGSKPGAKKPYVKPSCVSEPIYETLALACGKIPGQSALCNAVPRRS